MRLLMDIGFAGLITLLIAGFVDLRGVKAASEEVILLLQPLETESRTAGMLEESAREPFVMRTGKVVFAAEELLPDSAGPSVADAASARVVEELAGSRLLVSFFPGQEFTVTVDSVSRPSGTALVLGGSGSGMSAFSMTATAESYLMTFQDAQTGRMYRVVGDTTTGLGSVTELDPARLPPVYDTELVVPGAD